MISEAEGASQALSFQSTSLLMNLSSPYILPRLQPTPGNQASRGLKFMNICGDNLPPMTAIRVQNLFQVCHLGLLYCQSVLMSYSPCHFRVLS